MSKERLEEIKKRYDSATIVVFEGIDTVNVDVQDLDWLFEQAKLREEQVQRNLQALENISVLEGIYDRLEKENECYREALEFYAERKFYKVDAFSYNPELVDDGEVARKALEGEG